MAQVSMRAGVFDGERYETVRYPTDEIRLRVTDAGNVQVTEYFSEDREGPPPHLHEWDELEYVIEGRVEFFIDGRWIAGGPGTVQLLPAGTPHSVRVVEGRARLLMVTIGRAYDAFAKDVAAVQAKAPVDTVELVAAAARHGVRLA
jgi:quercetin dioxygenase-like cupin family protein